MRHPKVVEAGLAGPLKIGGEVALGVRTFLGREPGTGTDCGPAADALSNLPGHGFASCKRKLLPSADAGVTPPVQFFFCRGLCLQHARCQTPFLDLS